MTRLRSVAFIGVALSAAAATFVACSSDDNPGFSPDVDAAPDASLPETSTPADTGSGDAEAGSKDAGAIDANYDASDVPVTCATPPCATQLTAGDNHFCARLSDGTVRCWGDDGRGELGEGARDGGPTEYGPVTVATLANVTQVSASGAASCAVRVDGHVLCWGSNFFSQLGLAPPPDVTGIGDDDRHPTPSVIGLTAKLVRVDVGPENAYAIADDGKVYGWGNNDYMQLAMEDYNFYAPRQLDVQSYTFRYIGASFGAAVGLTHDGQLVGWGMVTGRASTVVNAPAPFPLLSLSNVDNFAIDSQNDSHACAISRGSLYCWGTNTKGVLGTGVPDPEIFPTLAPLFVDGAFPQQVAAGANTTCVRMTDGSIQCSGDNTLGQLGQGSAGPLSLSFAIATAFKAQAVQVVVSLAATCALTQDGEVMCWGGNSKGELGQGNNDLVAHPTPTKVVLK